MKDQGIPSRPLYFDNGPGDHRWAGTRQPRRGRLDPTMTGFRDVQRGTLRPAQDSGVHFHLKSVCALQSLGEQSRRSTPSPHPWPLIVQLAWFQFKDLLYSMAPPGLSVVDGANDDYHPFTNGNAKAITNGVTLNGHAEHQLNGHRTTNGTTLNGHSSRDYPPVDKVVNGSSSDGETPIAVCGMAVRLPGGVTTPQQLWDFLLAKSDARTRVPETRYNISAYHSTTPKPGTVATEYGFFLDESVDLGALDTSFFTMPRTEVERADPQQRLMLEVARECIEDAGVTNWRGKTIGCYMGSFGEDWTEMFAKEPQQYGMHRIVGYGDFALANRVSYEMDLRGPRYGVAAY